MHTPNYTILYVDSPAASARLYAKLLGAEPVEASPTFQLFALENGRILGLWTRSSVKPAHDFQGSGSELAFRVADGAEVDALHVRWKEAGLRILQAPVELDFGYTFCGADPDGHRVRVFARSE
ncbi:VOC family protein [Massilia sp. 9096]|uniref:VOC family protein n=1 Tax=Massilia sp. 9096 TaxID=1500894 RepID=UPI000561215E|nr:VOC family protein [Massilia sp. 9096]